MKFSFTTDGGAPICFSTSKWFFSVFLNPKVWAIDWHRNAECCKFWLLLGPFEINRIWADADEYPFKFGDEDEDENLHGGL
jgi:hypothetical protein